MFVPLYDDVEKRRPPIVSTLLIALNLIVFVYQFRLSLDDPTWRSYFHFIVKWGLKPIDVAHGKYLTMYTCMFLHGDFMHFMGNMVVLWAFAWTLEELLGPVRFFLMYMACGLAAGAAWCYFNWGSDVPCVGASGAIAGVMGAYVFQFGFSTKLRCMVLIFTRLVFFNISTMWFAGIWLGTQLLGVMNDSPDSPGGVAWWAHLGGFGAGVVMLPLLNENTRQLSADRDGSLAIYDLKEEEARLEAEKKAAEELAAQPVVCQTCETELEDDHLIAPKLYRCPGCGGLNMDPKALPPKKPAMAGRR
jgi:membrane associated rhomboid family serine protease